MTRTCPGCVVRRRRVVVFASGAVFVDRAPPTFSVTLLCSGKSLVTPRSLGTRLIEQCGARLLFSFFGRIGHLAYLRLAGVLGKTGSWG